MSIRTIAKKGKKIKVWEEIKFKAILIIVSIEGIFAIFVLKLRDFG